MTNPVTIQDAELQRLIHGITGALRDPGAMLDVAGEVMVNLSKITFERSKDPYGADWAPIKHRGTSQTTETYIDSKGKTRTREIWVGGIPLRDTGTLMNSITHAARQQYQVVGPGVEYGIIHQLGLGHVKQRPFLPTAEKGLPKSWERFMLDALSRKLRDVTGLR